jgi:hypothetical protein
MTPHAKRRGTPIPRFFIGLVLLKILQAKALVDSDKELQVDLKL